MNFYDYLKNKKLLYTGRGSTAIYLVLCANRIRGAQVLVPANICYAAVLPVIYSGNQPIFADVGEDGNLTSVTVAACRGSNIKAAIIPHMYGNPCREIAAIYNSLHSHDAIVIEDCASAMGTDIGGVMTGSFGDYAVYSFGQSKIIDCGYGGLIVSQRNLDDLATLNAQLPRHTPCIDEELQLLSQIYRVIRNNVTGILTEAVYECVRQRLQQCFLFQVSPEHVTRLSASLGGLEKIIRQRRKNALQYERHLNWNASMKRYTFHTGAVPWRYNILIDEARKPDLTAKLLRKKVPVSDWYPVIAPMFGTRTPFPHAKIMEKQLLNFPLTDVTEKQIQRITQAINSFF